MIDYRRTKKHVEEKESITCDKCKKLFMYDCNGPKEDWFEPYEFVSLDFKCGYGSETFGEGMRVKLDLCQYCFKDLIGDYCRTKQEDSLSEWKEEYNK